MKSANAAKSVKQTNHGSAIEISEAFATNLDTIRNIYMPGANTGAVIERFAGWMFHDMLNDEGELLHDAENQSYQSEEELQAVADRIIDFVKNRGGDAFLTYGWHRNGREWNLQFLRSQRDEEIYDFCIRKRWPFDDTREMFRAQVVELDKAAGLPPRNWITNPPKNVSEILAILEGKVRLEMEVAA